MIRTGLLGGSFNPAHAAHRGISRFALRLLGLDEVWWLVSPGNPLKNPDDMAPLAARLAIAREMARGVPIVPTAIEQELGTRYTVDTLDMLAGRYPKRRFIWLMGADNLAQFHLWKDWRGIARKTPIAVISRPGYNDDARTAPAMAWLRRYVRPASQSRNWTEWRPPAIVLLRFRPDPTSATALRRTDPHWHLSFDSTVPRDPLTRRRIP
ncbi:MAG: nicotinate-nucleotide adenylyltransferase [Parasphingopyxis sp.]